ncbi:putative protein N(5)-glutamine methyltransferase [Kineococcus sp. NUM-3379]
MPEPADLTAALRAAGCVFAEEEAALLLAQAGGASVLAGMLARRVGGEPLEQVLGWAGFRGRRYRLAPGVFVPRRRSALLVELGLDLAPAGAVVADVCCGCGALGAALASELAAASRPVAALHAADADPAAVACARGNLDGLGQVHRGDLCDALPAALRGRVHVLLAVPPYVPSGELHLMPREAREHEPRAALDGGGDGLAVLRRLAAQAPAWLAPGGHLLAEVGAGQGPTAAEVLRRNGLRAQVVHEEDTGATAVLGTLPRAR